MSLWPTPKGSPSGPDYNRINRPKSGGDDLVTAVNRKLMPTPTAQEYIERASTSSEKLNPLTGKSVTLDRFAKFWPDQEIQESGEPALWPTPQHHDNRPGHAERVGRHGIAHGARNLNDEAALWPTPTVDGLNNRKGISPKAGDGLSTAVKRLLPTPSVAMAEGGQTSRSGTRKGEKLLGGIAREMDEAELLPTPTQDMINNRTKPYAQGGMSLTAAVKNGLLPTPTAQDAKNNGGPSQHRRNTLPLNAVVLHPTPDEGAAKGRGAKSAAERGRLGGSLNANWVEYLMGFPIGWTETEGSPES